MKALRVSITSWTSSFRYPNFMIGYQPTLEVPPVSTIYGLLSAAKGESVTPDDVSVGYVFLHGGRGEDLESIYELSTGLRGKTNIIHRQFLYDCKLWLYLSDISFSTYFRNPEYQLVLGRSTDLATVSEISEIQLNPDENGKFGKTIVPFGTENAFGTIHSFPQYFDNSQIPRRAVNVSRYLVMDDFTKSPEWMPHDNELGWSIYFHGMQHQ